MNILKFCIITLSIIEFFAMLSVDEATKMAEMDYSALLGMSDPPIPNRQKIIKQVIDWFLGPGGQGKTSKEWSKRLLRPRPRLQPLSTTTEYATQYDTSIPLLPSSARIPYPFIILGGFVILGMFYLLLFLIIDRLRCCHKVLFILICFSGIALSLYILVLTGGRSPEEQS